MMAPLQKQESFFQRLAPNFFSQNRSRATKRFNISSLSVLNRFPEFGVAHGQELSEGLSSAGF